MIIQALAKYYDILAQDDGVDIPRYGYSVATVGYALTISMSGELVGVIPLSDLDSKGRAVLKKLTVPEQSKRAVNISPNFLCDNSTYVLGMDSKGKAERTAKCFQAFKELHQKILQRGKGKAIQAFLRYLDTWTTDAAASHPLLVQDMENLIDSTFVFRIDGSEGYLHQDLEVKALWEAFISDSLEDITGQCLVTGETSSIAVLHPSIKKVRGAQPTGASLVSFNASSYESYGKTQSLNSPTSKRAAFAYTTVLNHMLANYRQTVQVGDATTVFWAESPNNTYVNLAAMLLNPQENSQDEANGDTQDAKIEKLIQDILYRAKTGQPISDFDGELNPDTKFYILGLSPNVSRLSVRFFHAGTFGTFVEQVMQHYKDMRVIKDFDNRPTNIPIWRILAETASPKGREREASPLLAGSLMRAIVSGSPYPAVLFNSMIIRVRTDMDDKDAGIQRVNFIRVSLIKAYLLRKARALGINSLEEVLTVALNEKTSNIEYLLGRLFAILEKAQADANPGINATIKDRYFASACATPGAVFPILLRLAQHHIAKSEYGKAIEKRLEPIMNTITHFPAHLTLEQQGTFILGYYHQRVALYQKIQNAGGENNE